MNSGGDNRKENAINSRTALTQPCTYPTITCHIILQGSPAQTLMYAKPTLS